MYTSVWEFWFESKILYHKLRNAFIFPTIVARLSKVKRKRWDGNGIGNSLRKGKKPKNSKTSHQQRMFLINWCRYCCKWGWTSASSSSASPLWVRVMLNPLTLHHVEKVFIYMHKGLENPKNQPTNFWRVGLHGKRFLFAYRKHTFIATSLQVLWGKADLFMQCQLLIYINSMAPSDERCRVEDFLSFFEFSLNYMNHMLFSNVL